MSENMRVLLIVVAIGVVIFAYSQIKRRINLSKAANAGDNQRLAEAASQVLPGESGYKVVYAHWQRSEYHGRRTTTYYYSYALAFSAEYLWIIPLKYDGGIIDPQPPLRLTKDMLGVVETRGLEKKGKLWRVTLLLRDKSGKEFLQCWVDAENLCEDRFHHMNILQQEECERFNGFISNLAGQVAGENPDIEAHMAQSAAAASQGQAKKARVMGIVGLCGFFFPILSIIFGAVGLIIAPKPKTTDGKATSAFILPLLSLIAGILVCVVYGVLIALS